MLALSQNKHTLEKRIDQTIYLQHLIDFEKYPAFIIGILDNDSISYFTYSLKPETLPQKNTRFELGEVTQVFTALLTQKLMHKGAFSDTTKVVQLIPGLEACGFSPNITMGQLLSHHAGLEKVPDNIGVLQVPENPYRHYTIDDFKAYLCNINPEYEPSKSKYEYALTGYALLGLILQEVETIRLDKLFQQELFGPLKMDSTCLECNNESGLLASGFTTGGTVTPVWETMIFQGALGMESDMEDLMKFLRQMLSDNPTALTKAFKATITPVAGTGMQKNSWVAKGWHGYTLKKKYDICMATGHTGGHSAFIGFVEKTKTGVVILSGSEFSMAHVGFSVLEILNYNWKRK